MDNINRDSKSYAQIIYEYYAGDLKLKKLNELLKVHYDSTTPMDAYHTGMYNGVECVLSLLEEREPNYKTVEQPKDNK